MAEKLMWTNAPVVSVILTGECSLCDIERSRTAWDTEAGDGELPFDLHLAVNNYNW